VNVADQGHRAIMLYLVQRTDCDSFKLAGDIDPKYATGFDVVRSAGVEILCYRTNITPTDITVDKALAIDPSPQSPA